MTTAAALTATTRRTLADDAAAFTTTRVPSTLVRSKSFPLAPKLKVRSNVKHDFAALHRLSQRLLVVERTPNWRRSERFDLRLALRASGQRPHLPTMGDKVRDQAAADKAGAAGHERNSGLFGWLLGISHGEPLKLNDARPCRDRVQKSTNIIHIMFEFARGATLPSFFARKRRSICPQAPLQTTIRSESKFSIPREPRCVGTVRQRRTWSTSRVRLGTSHTTIYRHFRSKADIFDALVVEMMRDEEEMARKFVEARGSFAERLEGMVMALHAPASANGLLPTQRFTAYQQPDRGGAAGDHSGVLESYDFSGRPHPG